MDIAGVINAVVVGDVLPGSWPRGREAPGAEPVEDAPGGAAGAAVNLVALGARARLVGVVGDDPRAARLERSLRLLGVAADLLTVPGRHTAGHGEQHPIPEAAERDLLGRMSAALATADVVIACDYGGGVCTRAVRLALAGLPLLVVDAHGVARWRPCAPAAVLPDYAEAVRLLGDGDGCGDGVADRAAYLTGRSARLLELTGAAMVVTTLGGEGTLLHRAGRPPYRTHARPAPRHMAAGAGDAHTAAFALWLAAGATPEQAAEAGQAAAGVVVRRRGTAACTRHDLLRALRPHEGA